MFEEAKTFYPALTYTYLTKYVRMRKDSGYSIDLNNSDAEIAEILGCNATSIAIANLRQAFAEYDEYYSLKEKASDYVQPEERVSMNEIRSSVKSSLVYTSMVKQSEVMLKRPACQNQRYKSKSSMLLKN